MTDKELEVMFLDSAEDILKVALLSSHNYKNLSESDQNKITWIITKSIYLHRDQLMNNPKSYFENFKLLNEI